MANPAAGMVYLGGDYYGDPGTQITYDARTKTYSSGNYNWLVSQLQAQGKYVAPGQTNLTPEQQAAKAYSERSTERTSFEQEQKIGLQRLKSAAVSGQIRTAGQGAIVGIEAAKESERAAYKERVSFAQSQEATTPSEALAIQRMLRSPTAQFASQEVAQRGYELAAKYDRKFAPEQVRATLAPQYVPQTQEPQRAPSRFFYPAPKEQIGIRPDFPTPARPGSIAERAAFERRREGFYTYGTVRRLEGVSSRLQSGIERAVGYDERSSLPVKATVGFASAFTGLPAFAGQVAGAGEAIIRYPAASLRGLPTGFKILSSQVAEQARTKPIEFTGSLAGMATIGRYAPKVSMPKVTPEGFKALARSEEAILAPRRAKYEGIGSIDISKALERGVKQGFTGSQESTFGSRGYKPTGYKAPKPPESVKIIPFIKQEIPLPMERLKFQPVPSRPKLRPVMEIERPVVLKGLEQGILTKAEFMAQQKPGLRATPLSQLRTLPEIQASQKAQLKIIPYAQTPKAKTIVSLKTKPIRSTRQAISTQPLTKIKLIERLKTIPSTRIITMEATKTFTKVKPVVKTLVKTMPVTKVQTQLQTRTLTQLKTQLQTKRITKTKQERTKEPRLFKKQSSMLKGSRKYITTLGGKTAKQLEAELRGKKKTRQKRKK